MKYIITDFTGRSVTLAPRLELYAVKDFMGIELPGLAIILDDVTNPSEQEQYAVLTVSFGEFIGMKNCAYINEVDCDFASQLCEQGLAIDTGFYKASGFCQYPLWRFDENTLRDIDNETYQKYNDAFDSYMNSMYCEEPEEDSAQEIGL